MNQVPLLATGAPLPLPEDGSRIVHDAYYTATRLARAIVHIADRRRPIEGRGGDLQVGGGAFAGALLDLTAAEVLVADINPAAPGLTAWPGQPRPLARRPSRTLGGVDFLSLTAEQLGGRLDVLVGNPPYDAAQKHIEHGLMIADRVIFLLRLAFAEGQTRSQTFWRQFRPLLRSTWVLSERPSFTDQGGTDRYAYAVFDFDCCSAVNSGFHPGWEWPALTP